jgi:hypothetical protein
MAVSGFGDALRRDWETGMIRAMPPQIAVSYPEMLGSFSVLLGGFSAVPDGLLGIPGRMRKTGARG